MRFETTIFIAAFVIFGAGLLLSSSRGYRSTTARERRGAAEPAIVMRPVLLLSTTRAPVALC